MTNFDRLSDLRIHVCMKKKRRKIELEINGSCENSITALCIFVLVFSCVLWELKFGLHKPKVLFKMLEDKQSYPAVTRNLQE